MHCPDCGGDLPGVFRFCPHCGCRLAVPQASTGSGSTTDRTFLTRSALEGERKQVTVLFADLKGSLEMLSGRDPELARRILDPVLERMIAAVHHYEGTVNSVMGDGIMALFGAPRAIEDHAVRACLAGLRMQELLTQYDRQAQGELGVAIRVRIGVNTGDVVVRALGGDVRLDYTAVGETTHLAARLEQIAEPGSVCLSEETYRLVSDVVECEPLGDVIVKGRAQPVRRYRARHPRPVAARRPRRTTTLVGRDREVAAVVVPMMRLQAGYGGILFVSGDAGVGKSRLVAEALGHVSRDAVTVLEGRALSYGRRISHWPFVEVVKAAVRITDQDGPQASWAKLERRVEGLFQREAPEVLPYLATFLALDVPEPHRARVRFLDADAVGQQVFRSLRRFFQRLSDERPLLLLLEDLHWADESSTELVEHLFPLVQTQPILLCGTTRRDDPDGPGARLAATAKERHAEKYYEVVLSPLTGSQTGQLVSNLLGGAEVPPTLLASISQKADGNPFFIEEVVAGLVDIGALVRDSMSGQWLLTRDMMTITIPDNIQGVLMARVDRLDEDAKDVLKTASVIGRHFLYRVVREVTRAREDLDQRLVELVKGEFLVEEWQKPDLEYLFKHALVQEAVYESLLRDQRKQLHRVVGESIETLFPERLEEFYGLLAYHFTRAEMWVKARDYLLRAGDQAGRLAGDAEALAHYRQAFDAYERTSGERWDPRERAVLEQRMAEALFRRGDHDQAEALLQQALESLGSRRLPSRKLDVMLAIAATLGRRLLARIGLGGKPLDRDIASELCRVYEMMGWIDIYKNQQRIVLEVLHQLQASEAAQLSGTRAQALIGLGLVCDFIPQRRIARYFHERAIECAKGANHPVAMGYACLGMGVHHQYQGDWNDAMTMLERAAEAMRAAGHLKGWAQAAVSVDLLLYQRGEFDASLRVIDEVVRTGRDTGERQILGWGLQDLGMVLMSRNGAYDEAGGHLEEALQLFREVPDFYSLTFSLGMLGHCHLARGELDRARHILDDADRMIGVYRVRGPWLSPVLSGQAVAALRALEAAAPGQRAPEARRASERCKRVLDHARQYAESRPVAFRHQGTFEWLMGREHTAERWWSQSVRAAEGLGARYELGLALQEKGRRARDEAVLYRAFDIFEEIGAQPALTETRGLLSRLRTEPGRRPSP